MKASLRVMITVAALAIGFPAYAGEGDGPNFPGLCNRARFSRTLRRFRLARRPIL
jgi:hypothetical protein